MAAQHGTAALVHGRRSRAAAGAVTVQPGEPAVDKMSWRMPPLSELPPAVIKGGKRIGLLGLRGYLAVAMVMVMVKVVETALDH